MLRFTPIILLLLLADASIAQVHWATKVVDFSSQYDDLGHSASQVLGTPDVEPELKARTGAWMPGYRLVNGRQLELTGEQYLTVEFDTVMSVQQIVVVGKGVSAIVTKIFAYTDRGREVLVYEPKTKSQQLLIPALAANFEQVDRVKQVKVVMSPTQNAGWEQIDAIGIADHHSKIRLRFEATHSRPITNVQHAGDLINTPASELPDAILPDASQLFFSRASEDMTNADVHLAQLDLEGVTSVQHLKGEINDPSHNFVGGVSLASTAIAVAMSGEIGIAHKEATRWNPALVQQIDSFYTHADFFSFCMTSDERAIIMALEREDSYGGTDLYVSNRRENGTWTAPRNLGREINTVLNETAPTLAYDNRYLYFSSNGHSGFGGYDIFYSAASDNQLTRWYPAVNLSPKINSEYNEQFFVVDQGYTTAFFGSDRPGGKGSDDIYIVSFEQSDTGLTLIGRVYDSITKKEVIARMEADLLPSRIAVAVDSSTAQGYLLELPYLAKYELRITADGYFPVTGFLSSPRYMDERKLVKNIALMPLNPGSAIALRGIEFEIGSAVLTQNSGPALEAVRKLLASNPLMKVEIAGHTDNVGDEAANLELSIARAQAVVDYLIGKGVRREQMVVKGYGESQPLTTNNSAIGRERNRRVEFIVIE